MQEVNYYQGQRPHDRLQASRLVVRQNNLREHQVRRPPARPGARRKAGFTLPERLIGRSTARVVAEEIGQGEKPAPQHRARFAGGTCSPSGAGAPSWPRPLPRSRTTSRRYLMRLLVADRLRLMTGRGPHRASADDISAEVPLSIAHRDSLNHTKRELLNGRCAAARRPEDRGGKQEHSTNRNTQQDHRRSPEDDFARTPISPAAASTSKRIQPHLLHSSARSAHHTRWRHLEPRRGQDR